MNIKKINPLEKVRATIKELIDENKTIPNLLELKDNILETVDQKIDKLLAEKSIIKRIKFPKLKFNLRWVISIPFIYGMFIPSVIFHLFLELYHQICFRLYQIPIVDRKKYFVYDRQLLSMLNPLEKFNCIYCSYVNNLIRYASEIGGRTERYWCPIKYYRRIEKPHSQYDKFVSGKESKKEMLEKWEELRDFSDLEEK